MPSNTATGTYSPNVGIGVFPNPVRQPRNPTTLDVQYPLNQLWINTSTEEIFYLSSFTSTSGTVLANWHAQGGADSFIVDDSTAPGTNPVVPDNSGDVTITGGQVSSSTIGANVIRTNSLSENSFTIQIQQSGESAAQDTTLNGVCHFDSTHFNVSNGFVTLSGGGMAVDSFTPDTGTTPVVPSGTGNVSITGQTPANVSGIQVTGGTNSLSFSMFSPFKGDFTFTESVAGNSEIVTVSHTDNTASNNGAVFSASVAGTTQTGDAYNLWSVGSTRSYSLGPDTSDSQILKLTTTNASSVTPSTGTFLASFDPSANGNFVFDPQGVGQVVIGLGSPTVAVAPDLISLSVCDSTVAGTLAMEVFNTDNTNASSRSNLNIRVGGGSAGDPVCTWIVNGGSIWSSGIDNSDSDKWKLASNSILGTANDTIVCTISGAITEPLQPSFLATHTSDQLNVTGNGTIAIVNFTTEVFDRNSNYDGTNTFTAPVTGIYFFCASVQFGGLSAAAISGDIRIFTTSRTFLTQSFAFGSVRDFNNAIILSTSVIAPMTAGDVARVQGFVNGMGADTISFPLNTLTETYFSGYLVC